MYIRNISSNDFEMAEQLRVAQGLDPDILSLSSNSVCGEFQLSSSICTKYTNFQLMKQVDKIVYNTHDQEACTKHYGFHFDVQVHGKGDAEEICISEHLS